MNKWSKRIGVSAIMAATVFSAVFIVFSFSRAPALEWYVEPGTTLTYHIEVYGYTLVNATEHEPPPFSHLNNSQMTLEVISLPEVSAGLDGVSFSETVIEATKTNLTVPILYENGTIVTDSPHDLLNGLVSHCLLPIDGWPYLDSFYPDKPDFAFGCDTYLSRFGARGFLIGHRYFIIDAGRGWHGTVALETGIPMTAEVWESKYYGNEWLSYQIVLTLVQT